MLEDDGDIVKSLGFVSLHASYLEEQIENLVTMLEPVKKYTKGWHISDRIIHAKKAIRKLNREEFDELLIDLDTCLDIFQDRNELLHRTIYSGLGRPDTLKSSKADIPDRPVYSSELYQLANEMTNFREGISRSMFGLPQAVAMYKNESA